MLVYVSVYSTPIPQNSLINTSCSLIQVRHNSHIGVTRCQGVVIQGLKATLAPRRPTQDQPLLETYQLVPLGLTPDHPITPHLTTETGLGLLLDLVLENLLTHRVKIVERTENRELIGVSSLPLTILKVLASRPQLKVSNKGFTKIRMFLFLIYEELIFIRSFSTEFLYFTFIFTHIL